MHHTPVLEYIAGYILKRFKIECEPGNSKWIRNVSKGGLRIPSASFTEAVNQLEQVFKLLNGCNIYRGKDYVNHHISSEEHVNLSLPIKECFLE